MIRSAFKFATVIAGFLLAGSSVLHADSFAPSGDRNHAHSQPSVKTYAAGLNSPGKRTKVLSGFASLPNGLVEGPDGALYTSNWGISFAPGDGEVLRSVP